MWLINTSTLDLEHVVHEREKRYAILSHTWGDEEASFQDMKTGEATLKKGWAKVDGACRKAREGKYEYIWIDTVCINKESSAELSEAINSMWLYYSRSHVCYAYLSDVSEDCPKLRPEDDWISGHWQQIFSNARWFSRGWTLQELIAPEEVVFFHRGWDRIGSKSTLSQALSKITGIVESVLLDRTTIDSNTIARRMSWAAHRSTSREEDQAYSLLGLFGINMPLIYGEREKAFIRLQEEIIKNSTDHSIFAWQPTEFFYFQSDLIFAERPSLFSHAAKIVSTTVGVASTPYQLTNGGLRFDALRLCESGKDHLGILNCRYYDDVEGPIAVCLRIYDEPSKDSCTEGGIYLANTDQNRFGRGRTTIVDESTAFHAIPKPCTLLRYIPSSGPPIVPPTYSKIWLCKDETSPVDFEILDTCPRHRWNTSTRVLCLSGHGITTALKIRVAPTAVLFLIISMREYEDSKEQELGRDRLAARNTCTDAFWMTLTRAFSSSNCEEVVRDTYAFASHMSENPEVEVNGTRYYAHVKKESRMGDTVYVIRIGRGRKDQRERKRVKFQRTHFTLKRTESRRRRAAAQAEIRAVRSSMLSSSK